jgi:lysophospholipase L1-like esterase
VRSAIAIVEVPLRPEPTTKTTLRCMVRTLSTPGRCQTRPVDRSSPRLVAALLTTLLVAALLGTPAAAEATPASGAAERQRPRVLFFGDSYVIGGPYAGPRRTMAALAAARLGWRAVLRGGGGTGFATTNPEYGLGTFLDQVADGALDVGPVDHLVVEGGSNDRFLPPRVVERAALRTLRAALAQHPEARVVLVGTLDPTVEDFSDFDPVTRALRRAAARAGVPYVDAQRWLEGRPELVGPDYVHPTAAGNVVLGRLLARSLRRLT